MKDMFLERLDSIEHELTRIKGHDTYLINEAYNQTLLGDVT